MKPLWASTPSGRPDICAQEFARARVASGGGGSIVDFQSPEQSKHGSRTL